MAACRRMGSKGDDASVPNLAPPSDPHKPAGFTASPPIPAKSELVFHCQLAHGSQTREVKDFSSVKELYTRIAGAFDISPEDVRLTLETQLRVEMKGRESYKIADNNLKVMHTRNF